MRMPWPRSLFSRLMLIWLIGIAVVLAVSLALFVGERDRVERSALFEGIAQEIAAAADVLDRLTPGERERWIDELGRDRIAEERQRFPERDTVVTEVEPVRLPLVEERPADPLTGHVEEEAAVVGEPIRRVRCEGGIVEQAALGGIGDAEAAEQDLVDGSGVFRVVLIALAFEVLDSVEVASVRVAFLELLGEREAKDWQTAGLLPEILEAEDEIVAQSIPAESA